MREAWIFETKTQNEFFWLLLHPPSICTIGTFLESIILFASYLTLHIEYTHFERIFNFLLKEYKVNLRMQFKGNSNQLPLNLIKTIFAN